MMRLPSQRLARVLLHRTAVVTAAVLLVVGLASVGGAEEAHELRGEVPAGAEVRQQLAELAEHRTHLVGELARTEGELAAAVVSLDDLGEAAAQLAHEIEMLRESVRTLVVRSFVTGGPGSEVRRAADAEAVSEVSWRRHLIHTLAEPLDDNSIRLQDLEAQADAELLMLVDLIEALRQQIEQIESELADLLGAEWEAGDLLVLADAWDRAEIAIAEGDHGFAPRHKWEALRFCESTDDYRAVSPSGRYRGAYQFDLSTWQTTGGTGDPAAAPPAEQDARARELYARRGHQPWPVCGRHLQ